MDRRTFQNDDAYRFQPVSERYFLFGDDDLTDDEEWQRDEEFESIYRFDRRENDRFVAADHFDNRPVSYDSRDRSARAFDQSLAYSRQLQAQTGSAFAAPHESRTLQGSKIG